jgi:hypothetical protein
MMKRLLQSHGPLLVFVVPIKLYGCTRMPDWLDEHDVMQFCAELVDQYQEAIHKIRLWKKYTSRKWYTGIAQLGKRAVLFTAAP